jgi:hypothetical protein
MRKIKVGDRVVMKNGGMVMKNGGTDSRTWRTKFRIGIVKRVDGGWISIKRTGYKGHEYTWWTAEDWKAY